MAASLVMRRPMAVPVEAETVPPARTEGGIGVTLRDIRKRFGDNEVLRGIDLRIEPGQFVAVVGRSGCGKSTLLRLVAGLDKPSAGQLALDTEAAGPEAVRIMFQEPRLLPWARVIANVEVGLDRVDEAGERPRRAKAALRAVGLHDRCQDWPSVLSGGQKQRVALARALVSRPRLLAFDEPLGALDALTRIEMQGLLERVWQDQGFTALLVTHDVAEALALADRVLLIEDGEIGLDLAIDLPRPRRRGSAELARLEGEVLDRLFGGAGASH